MEASVSPAQGGLYRNCSVCEEKAYDMNTYYDLFVQIISNYTLVSGPLYVWVCYFNRASNSKDLSKVSRSVENRGAKL